MDVAGLNQITVLIDRSQTSLTEVGLNMWYVGLEGPPHFHDGKEQIFFVLSGTAEVIVSGQTFQVKPNDLIHVPLGAMHRTVVDVGQPLTYLLFNAFKDHQKEGKASFVDHLAEAKHVRRRQADEAAQGVPIDWARTSTKGRCIEVAASRPEDAQGTQWVTLLSPDETYRAAADLVVQGPGQEQKLNLRSNSEHILFVLGGTGFVRVAGKGWPVGSGDVLYIPGDRETTAQADEQGLSFLSLDTILS